MEFKIIHHCCSLFSSKKSRNQITEGNIVLLYSLLSVPFWQSFLPFPRFSLPFSRTLLFSETHFTNAKTCNFFMTLKSLIYFARSLMRPAGRNGTWVFYEPPKGQFLFKKRMARTDRVTGIFTACLRGAKLPRKLHSSRVYRREGFSNLACTQLTFVLRDEG